MTRYKSVTDDQLGQYYRKMNAIAERLGKSLSFDDVMEALQRIHDGEMRLLPQIQQKVTLRLIRHAFARNPLLPLSQCEAVPIANAKEVFGKIDKEFVSISSDKLNQPTAPTEVEVFQAIEVGSIIEFFRDFGVDLDVLCLTQGQIVEFCRCYPNRLLTGYNLFLLKTEDSYRVANVVADPWRRSVYLSRLKDEEEVYSRSNSPRIFVKRLPKT